MMPTAVRTCSLLYTLFGTLALLTPAVQAQTLPRAELLAVYRQAQAHDAELRAARADFAARQEAIPQARANLLPSLSSSASFDAVHLSRDEPQLARTRNTQSVQANLRQSLINLAFWYELAAADASVAQAGLELSDKEQGLLLRSAEAYFETLRASDELAAMQAEETALRQQLEQAKARLHSGMSSITDVLDAEAAHDNAQANRKLAERKVEDAFEVLTRLTDIRYLGIEGMQHSMPVAAPTPADAQAWVESAGRQNLGLLASNFAVQAAEERLHQQRAGHAPTVDAVASYRRGDNDAFGYSNPSDFGRDGYRRYIDEGRIGIEVSLPLYSGGRVSSRSREAYERLVQSEEQREGLRREVVYSTRNFYRAVNSDIEQINARRQTILSSQGSLRANKAGADLGTRNTVDVLNAQRQLYRAVREYNNARYDYILNTLRLQQAAGTLDEADLRQLSTYLKQDYQPSNDFLPPELKARERAG